MQSQQDVISSLPNHLQPYVATQDYSLYSPRDQAVWRFLLYQLSENLASTAEKIYTQGLIETGIGLESIPKIEEINRALQKIGWRAVVVDGFLPPAIFMEFQALKVLVIAVDIRTINHMLYTPAPDIVHESAGHAPFIIDVDYAEFLQRFGELGMRAISNKGDIEVYNAIRHLSIIKGDDSASAVDIQKAESALKDAISANNVPSESALLSRLHWWTVEYGLVGTIDNYKIFGAGLLSSLGESVDCLDDKKVIKKTLTVDAINTKYDITEQQPNLFVTKNCRHLSQVLEEFAHQMCFTRGGAEALNKAIDAETVNTCVLNSGIEISGQFSTLISDAVGNPIYLQACGPTQLAYQSAELENQGIEYHNSGYGSPIGKLQGMERCLSVHTVDELKQHAIALNQPIRLEFLSGIVVSGMLIGITRREQKNVLFSIQQCTVKSADGSLLFHPDWGVYDMAIGHSISSVYGGSADKAAYPLYTSIEQSTPELAVDNATEERFIQYAKLRCLREEPTRNIKAARELIGHIEKQYADEWLLIFEALELSILFKLEPESAQRLKEQLLVLQENSNRETAQLIDYGLMRFKLLKSHQSLAEPC
jgi:phenylalanine-4-hydroxylase